MSLPFDMFFFNFLFGKLMTMIMAKDHDIKLQEQLAMLHKQALF
jgi:hypothetical protein